MYLSRFSVKNYKCLADVDIPLTPIHVLIGPNDSGKTSLIEAIAALYGAHKGSIGDAFPQPWTGRDLVFHGSRTTTVAFFAEWQEAQQAEQDRAAANLRYQLGLKFSSKGASCFPGGEWVGMGEKGRGLAMSHDTYTALHQHAAGKRDWDGFGKQYEDRDLEARMLAIRDVLKPAPTYSFQPRLMAVPAAPDLQRKFKLDPDGFGLATLLQDIVSYDPKLFLDLRDQFCTFLPQFRNVRTETEKACVRHYKASGTHTTSESVGVGIYFESRSGQTVRAQQASDGAILFLGFLALAHLPEPPTLLLLEEPENGIYPKRLGEVIQMLRQLVTRTEGARFPQIIMTTHSPYVLSFFEPEEVTFLSRDPEHPEAGVRARPLRDAPNIKERLGGGAFYLGELWYNLSEEELFGGP